MKELSLNDENTLMPNISSANKSQQKKANQLRDKVPAHRCLGMYEESESMPL